MSFQNSYQSLPSIFFAPQNPEQSDNPECVLYNTDLAKELKITELLSPENVHNLLSGNILLWEWETPEWKLVDIVLKGSWKTPFSRWGDGRATMKAMLREYLMSEAVHGLGITSSRSLAVVKTWNDIYRESIEDWAILTRIMSSHIRVGTFEFAKLFGSKDDMKALS